MKIWLVSMECAGLAEAGGVKDVVYSLCKGFAANQEDVTLFIPVFGCSTFEIVKDFCPENIKDVPVSICGRKESVSYSTGKFKDSACRIVFVNHSSFKEKLGVYCYTAEEQKINSEHIRGNGHSDGLFIDALFSKAVVEYARYISSNDFPDIIHCHDASTAVIPCYVKEMQEKGFYKNSKCVVTIHNAGPAYHHEYKDVNEALFYTGLDEKMLQGALNGFRVEPFLLSLNNASLSTVSSFYAEELRNPENYELTDGLSLQFCKRNIKIEGITNGIDISNYDPEKTEISLLPYKMNPKAGDYRGKLKNRNYFLNLCNQTFVSDIEYLDGLSRYGWIDVPSENPVYFMYHGRIVWQKGIPLLLEAIPELIKRYPSARFFICGQGEPDIENKIKEITGEFDGKVVFFNGYNPRMARLVAAAADFVVLPSHFEPCGLEDFISQIYGCLPIAHATGGLKKIIDGETGYLYKNNEVSALIEAACRAVDYLYSGLENQLGLTEWTSQFVQSFYSWDFVIQAKYLKFFKKCKFSY